MKHVHQVKPAAALLSVIYYDFFKYFFMLGPQIYSMFERCTIHLERYLSSLVCFFCSFCNVCTQKNALFSFPPSCGGSRRHFWSGLFISNFLTITLCCGLKSLLPSRTRRDAAKGAKKFRVATSFLVYVCFWSKKVKYASRTGSECGVLN